MRLAVLASHPIQYNAPLYRTFAGRCDLHVFYAHRATPQQQAAAGFGEAFEWDVDLTSGYEHSFLRNVAARPGVDHFAGCDTPEIGQKLDQGFDALLVAGWHLKCNLQAIWAARRRGVAVLVRGDSQLDTPRSPIKRLGKEMLYPPLLRAFDKVLYVGSRSRDYYEHYHYPKARMVSSPHCVDTEWFAARAAEAGRGRLRHTLGIGDDERVVLFAGKLQAFKRPLDVVEACALAPGPAMRVIVAGSGELAEPLAARAADLGVKLDQLGFQNQSQMPAAYAAADVLMLPSDANETWGLVCNEALACGTPILVSDAVGCAEDLAGDGVAGSVYPLGDVAASATALERLLSHPPAAAAIAARSQRHSLAAATDGVLAAMKMEA